MQVYDYCEGNTVLLVKSKNNVMLYFSSPFSDELSPTEVALGDDPRSAISAAVPILYERHLHQNKKTNIYYLKAI